MSNVLIGIIGIILFIGLALAGALFLGPRFQTASASAQASTLLSHLKQTADAADMYKLDTGARYVPAIEADFLVPQYLKAVPTNPTAAASAAEQSYPYRPHFSIYAQSYDLSGAGTDPHGRLPQFAGGIVVAAIGPTSDPRAKDVCEAIARSQPGGTIDRDDESVVTPPGRAGCRVSDVVENGDYVPVYAAWYRLEGSDAFQGAPSGYAGS